ncbi:MAG: hypothetical protein KAR05_10955 [Candidatus Omnitrophica bacterium]|nr:hypothetical protein [Candidatus Omnitrophota bacterium]
MKRKSYICIIVLLTTLCLFSGCATVPKGFLKLSEDNLEKRQLQMKQYDTQDETQIIQATAGVLQDLGFILADSETELGLVVAKKSADATSAGQVVLAGLADVLNALSGTPSNASATVDKVQDVKASVIIRASLEGGKTVVRITFQRIVWNASGQVNRVETMSEPELYQKFFDSLSKAVFLEANQI